MRRIFLARGGIRYPNQNSKLSIRSSNYGGGVVGGWVAKVQIQTNLKTLLPRAKSESFTKCCNQSISGHHNIDHHLASQDWCDHKKSNPSQTNTNPSLDKTFRTDNISTLFGHLAFLRTSIPLAFLDFLIEKLHHRYYNFSLLHRHWQQIYINSSLSRQLSSYYFLY